MIFAKLVLLELARTEKATVDNCYDTNSDINIFADTMQIILTITST